MALITASPEENWRPPSNRQWQRYLAYLETLIDGEPGRPRVTPEPFEPVEAQELIDSPTVAPPPDKPRKQRKRKPVRKADMPARDPHSINLARYARKLSGRD